MKYLNLLGVLIVMVVFSGCSEEDQQENFQNDILGRWYRLGTPGKTSFSYHDNACPSNKDYREFFSDGTGIIKAYGTSCQEIQNSAFSWVINGEYLIINNNVEAASKIYSISEKEMIVETTSGAPSSGFFTSTFVYYKND